MKWSKQQEIRKKIAAAFERAEIPFGWIQIMETTVGELVFLVWVVGNGNEALEIVNSVSEEIICGEEHLDEEVIVCVALRDTCWGG